jgi:predicted dehydrogenase
MSLSAASAGSERDLSLALIGAGHWGSTLMRAIEAHQGLALAAVIVSKPAKGVPGAQSVPIFATWQEAARNLPLDGFVLTLPPDRQPEIAEQIITNGFPAFLEKPLALSRDAAARLLAAGRQFDFIGVVDHIHLFAAEFAELCRRLPQGETVLSIETVSGNRGPYSNRWTSCWEWAPHDIAMCLAVMGGMPASVTARIVRSIVDNGKVFENYEIDLDFGQRGQACITTGNAFDTPCREFRVSSGDASLIYAESADRVRSLVRESGGRREKITVESVPPLDAALDEFADRIRRKTIGINDLELGACVVDICAAAHESVKSARIQTVSGL